MTRYGEPYEMENEEPRFSGMYRHSVSIQSGKDRRAKAFFPSRRGLQCCDMWSKLFALLNSSRRASPADASAMVSEDGNQQNKRDRHAQHVK
jgi:hypothetical protein